MSGSITDVHDQHTAESRLDLATRAARIGLWDWDPRAGTVRLTPEFERLYGLAPGTLYDDLLIQGFGTSEMYDAAPGYIRAYHLPSGELR